MTLRWVLGILWVFCAFDARAGLVDHALPVPTDQQAHQSRHP